MLEYEKKHMRGKKTLFYIFLRHTWHMTLIGLGLLYLSGSIYFGRLNAPVGNFLAKHPNWFVDVSMLSQIALLFGLAFLAISALVAYVHYHHYRFLLDEYAVHLHHGLIFTQEITIPYVQISNVHIARPYHYRMFGIAKFDIVTAADRDLDRSEKDHKSKVFFLPIVDINIARTPSKQLLQAASKSRKGEHVYKDEDGDGIDDETGEEIPEGAEIENTDDEPITIESDDTGPIEYPTIKL